MISEHDDEVDDDEAINEGRDDELVAAVAAGFEDEVVVCNRLLAACLSFSHLAIALKHFPTSISVSLPVSPSDRNRSLSINFKSASTNRPV